MVMDWLSIGLDPAKSVLFRQSRVKEHAELHLLYSMITPVPWLERNPTYKEQLKEIVGRIYRPTVSSAIRCCRRPISRFTKPTKFRSASIRRLMSS